MRKVEKKIKVLQFQYPDKNTEKGNTKESRKTDKTQEKHQRNPSPRWAYEF